MAYNFSIALSIRDEKTQDKYWQVIRGCSAHRNFHYHHYKYRSDRSVVEENRPLNSIMEHIRNRVNEDPKPSTEAAE